jgi:hypothetical protein
MALVVLLPVSALGAHSGEPPRHRPALTSSRPVDSRNEKGRRVRIPLYRRGAEVAHRGEPPLQRLQRVLHAAQDYAHLRQVSLRNTLVLGSAVFWLFSGGPTPARPVVDPPATPAQSSVVAGLAALALETSRHARANKHRRRKRNTLSAVWRISNAFTWLQLARVAAQIAGEHSPVSGRGNLRATRRGPLIELALARRMVELTAAQREATLTEVVYFGGVASRALMLTDTDQLHWAPELNGARPLFRGDDPQLDRLTEPLTPEQRLVLARIVASEVQMRLELLTRHPHDPLPGIVIAPQLIEARLMAGPDPELFAALDRLRKHTDVLVTSEELWPVEPGAWDSLIDSIPPTNPLVLRD